MEEDNSAYNIMLWIPKFFFLIIVTSVLMAIIYSVQYQDVNSEDVEMNLLIASVMHSPDGIVYQDPYIKRSYSNVIDFQKFQNMDFNDLFQTQSKRYVMHVELKSEHLNQSYSRYYISGSESTEENFVTRIVVSDFSERMNPLGKIDKYVTVVNHKDSPFEAKLTFDVYIEK
ncbi:hypothetical protein KY334_03785 [Candidatus Woesearchaeota archaeon]|nr:hypothetical protein [Candidatus Woesearchaeota archaeon]